MPNARILWSQTPQQATYVGVRPCLVCAFMSNATVVAALCFHAQRGSCGHTRSAEDNSSTKLSATCGIKYELGDVAVLLPTQVWEQTKQLPQFRRRSCGAIWRNCGSE